MGGGRGADPKGKLLLSMTENGKEYSEAGPRSTVSQPLGKEAMGSSPITGNQSKKEDS